MRILLMILVFWMTGNVAFSQATITGNIKGNPPYKKALLKVSFGSFPAAIDSVAIVNGKFQFVIQDSIMKKRPSISMIGIRDSTGRIKDLTWVNFMVPEHQENRFILSDTTIVISGTYDAAKKVQAYTITRTPDNAVLYQGLQKNLQGLGKRESALDSLYQMVVNYPTSNYLQKHIHDFKSWFKTEELKKFVAAYPEDMLNTYYGNKLKIYLQNRVAEDEHHEYANLKLQDKAGKETLIFNELKEVNLIIFWTSWCTPCKAEIPTLKKLYEELTKRGVSVQFVHVSVDEKRDLWVKADDKAAFPWRSLWSSSAQSVAAKYNYGLPSNFLVTKDKRIHRIEVREQEGIDEIWKAAGLKPEKFDYPKTK